MPVQEVCVAGKITLLPPEVTNKIAAGEVVERPASILKELLENAVDSGASEIVVHLEQGGRGSIRVTDNGEGMDPDDVSLAFRRHATSKIRGFDDIYSVRSFGFRGEAIPSIASIARLEILSRRKESVSGTRAVAEAGDRPEISEAGCPAGTSVLVDRIFESVPVRKKFLKTDATEQGYCSDAITRIALSHREIKIRVINNGREAFNVPAAASTPERVALVLGEDLAKSLVPARARRAAVSVEGMVSVPTLAKGSARHVFFFVNGRYIRDHFLHHAVMTAYRHLLEAKKYPAAVLFIELPPAEVDVNVHPAKLEVRFQNPRVVYEAVLEAVAGSLAGIRPAMPGETHAATGRGGLDLDRYRARVEEALRRYTPLSPGAGLFAASQAGGAHPAPLEIDGGAPSANEAKTGPDAAFSFSALSYLGQVTGTYLVFSAPFGLVLLDQHAAHERVLFEKFRAASGVAERSVGQRLLVPEVITLSARDMPFVTESLPLLNATGMEIEPFGNEAVVVKSMPAMLAGTKPADVIGELTEGFSPSDRLLGLKERQEKIFALLACKGAVKAGHVLSKPEVDALCRDLDATPFAATCPHGRPLFLLLSPGELERMFRRR